MIIEIDTPDGKTLELNAPDNATPDQIHQAATAASSNYKTDSEYSLKGFAENAAKGASKNLTALGALPLAIPTMGRHFPGPLNALSIIKGEDPNSPQGAINSAKGIWKGTKEGAKQFVQDLSHPYDDPVSFLLNVETLASGGMGLARMASKGVSTAAKAIGPSMARGTAGIPELATEMALKDPAIFKKLPVPESELNRVVGEPVIKTMQELKQLTGKRFGKIFKRYAGMEGPMQEIIDTPVAQKLLKVEKKVPVAQELKTIEGIKDPITGKAPKKLVGGEMIMGKETSFKPGNQIAIPRKFPNSEELIVDKNLAQKAFGEGDNQALGELYKKYVGTRKSDLSEIKIDNKAKLQILTRMKRGTQKLIDFNKAPITNAPIDTAKDAAFKKIASDLDSLRTNLPNGEKLAAVDDAWKSVNDIYDTIQKDLSDPGRAKDTMMRLMRGDNTWLTSGKMKVKMDAIAKVEKMTGKSILKPAMEELTRQVFSQNLGKGFTANMMKTIATALAGFGAGTLNPVPVAGAGAVLASSSPKLLRTAIKAGSKVGEMLEPSISGATHAGAMAAGPLMSVAKQLTEDLVRKYLRKAKGDPEKARAAAKKDGYTEIPE